MKVFGRKFFSEWIINGCVVSVSVSRYRIRSSSFCLDLDLAYVTTLIFKNNIRSCARLDSITVSYVILVYTLYLKLQHMFWILDFIFVTRYRSTLIL